MMMMVMMMMMMIRSVGIPCAHHDDDDDDDHGQPQAHRVRGRKMGWSLRLVTDVDDEINCEDIDVEEQGNHAKDD